MNKLLLNPKARNHIKYQPLSLDNIPEDESEQIKMVEDLYDELVDKGVILYEKVKIGSHSIKTVRLDERYFIVTSLRNEFGTYNNRIDEIKNRNDAVAVATFIGKNIRTTMKDYKKQILDAKKMVVRKEDIDEGNKTSEND